MRGTRDRLDGEELPGVVLDPAEEHERERRALARDRVEDVGRAERVLARARRELEDGGGGVEAVRGRLRGHRILCRAVRFEFALLQQGIPSAEGGEHAPGPKGRRAPRRGSCSASLSGGRTC